MNKNVDYIKFFEELLEKYEKDSQRIQLNLHIAMSCEKQNIPKALIHFENAIKLDPHSGFLSVIIISLFCFFSFFNNNFSFCFQHLIIVLYFGFSVCLF